MVERSTASDAWAALLSVNLTVSMKVLALLESPMTEPLTLMVD